MTQARRSVELTAALSRPRLLVGVRDAGEARVAALAGADLVDAKDPDAGALGALPPETVRAICAAAGDEVATSAVAGQASSLGDLVARIRVAAACGVDLVKVAVPPGLAADPGIDRLSAPLRALATPTVAVLFAEDRPQPGILPSLALAGFAGAMIDTGSKDGRRLLDHLAPETLARFVGVCRALGMVSGLAGSLALDDILGLAALGPSYQGFRGGVCAGGDRTGALDPERIAEASRRLARAGEAP